MDEAAKMIVGVMALFILLLAIPLWLPCWLVYKALQWSEIGKI